MTKKIVTQPTKPAPYHRAAVLPGELPRPPSVEPPKSAKR
jgi:hypothetical protein